MEEEWRAVPGFEAYEVSDRGRVRRVAPGKSTHPGRLLKLRARKRASHSKPRFSVALSYEGQEKSLDVSTLVAAAFLGPRPKGQEVNHIDGIPSNNAASNLEYCTRRENMQHAYRMGLSARLGVGEDQHLARLTTEQIIVIRNCTAPVRLLARVFGVTPITIKRAQIGVTWKHV